MALYATALYGGNFLAPVWAGVCRVVEQGALETN